MDWAGAARRGPRRTDLAAQGSNLARAAPAFLARRSGAFLHALAGEGIRVPAADRAAACRAGWTYPGAPSARLAGFRSGALDGAPPVAAARNFLASPPACGHG